MTATAARTVRVGLLGSGFVAGFCVQGLRHVANWEIPVVSSPHREHAQAFVDRWRLGGTRDTTRRCCSPSG